jgi:transcriptional regulator with XRE-family HTH domain
MDVRRIVSWNVRRIRVERGLTIEDLAGSAEIDSSYVGRVERGTVNSSIDVLARVALVLKVRVMELFMEPLPGAPKPSPLPPGRRASKPARARRG